MCLHFDVLVNSPNTQHSELPELPTAGRIMFVSKQNFFPIKKLSILPLFFHKNQIGRLEVPFQVDASMTIMSFHVQWRRLANSANQFRIKSFEWSHTIQHYKRKEI